MTIESTTGHLHFFSQFAVKIELSFLKAHAQNPAGEYNGRGREVFG